MSAGNPAAPVVSQTGGTPTALPASPTGVSVPADPVCHEVPPGTQTVTPEQP